MSLRIAVIGLGAWGSTLARLFADQGHQVQRLEPSPGR